MNPAAVQSDWHDELAAMRRTMRSVGMLFVACDQQGQLIWPFAADGDWLDGLFGNIASIKGALQEAVGAWSEQNEPELAKAMAGVWLMPVPILYRRRRAGYAVTIIPTVELLEGTNLEAVCRESGANVEDTRALLAALPPAVENNLAKLAVLTRSTYENKVKIAADQEAIENVGQQLAESYEEINLLYTITKSITEVDRPERLVSIACRELLATLPFSWIGAQLADDVRRLKRLSRRFILAGESNHPQEQLRILAKDLLEQATPDNPMIIEPNSPSTDARFEPFNRTILAYPISRDDRVIGLLIAGEKQGADPGISSADIKLVGATASHLSIFLENAALYDDLNAMFLGTLEALSSAIDAKDRYTCGHSQRVAHLTRQLAEAIGLDEYTVQRMHIAGVVHDVGKIGVPESVLTKPGRLTDEEFDLIKMHPEIGYRILKDIPQLQDILPGVLYHHESYNGRGYPKGLQGEQIPLVARVIALADSFDAMSSTRTYRNAMSRDEALAEINRCTGTQFDPQFAPIFVKLDFSEYDRMINEQHERDLRDGYLDDEAA